MSFRKRATEDIYGMAGLRSDEAEQRSLLGILRGRLPWLLVCLAGTLLSGVVINAFAEPLQQAWMLVVFVPAIMAMGGNAGIQTSTVTVRGLATGQIQPGEILGALFRETRLALGTGAFFGLLVFAVSFLWFGDLPLSTLVGLAMLSAVVISAVLGALVPLLFRRFGVDPAIASGPLVTTLNDVVSLLIYFGTAILLL